MFPDRLIVPQVSQASSEQDSSPDVNELSTNDLITDKTRRPFQPDLDLLFINNYVFEHCESPDATIYYTPDEETLPKSLDLVEHVAINASSLSMEKDELDSVWGKQLRFILSNFPSVLTITVIATTVTNLPRPLTCPLPYESFDPEAVSLDNLRRLGIENDFENVKLCFETKRPGNFAIQAWDDLIRNWPAWKARKMEDRYAPMLTLMGLVCFAQEWDNLEQEGEHGVSCELIAEKLPTGLRMVAKQQQQEKAERQVTEGREDVPPVPEIPSTYSRQKTSSMGSSTGSRSHALLEVLASSYAPTPRRPTRSSREEGLAIKISPSTLSLKTMSSREDDTTPRPSLSKMATTFSAFPESSAHEKSEGRPTLETSKSMVSLRKNRSIFMLRRKPSTPAQETED